MNQVEEDQKQFVFQLYPLHMVPESGLVGETTKSRRRRRRKSSKGDESGGKKRKLTDEQVNMLEMSFGNDHKLDSDRKDKLAMELGLDPRQVAVWFQNRRARWKTHKLEEEYSKLKKTHEAIVLEKCHLETQVMNLKEQLSEAKKTIHKFSEHSDGGSIGSPSSFSIEMSQQQFFSESVVEGFDNLFRAPDYGYSHDMGWGNFYGL